MTDEEHGQSNEAPRRETPKELALRLGLPLAPPDHPIYSIGTLIYTPIRPQRHDDQGRCGDNAVYGVPFGASVGKCPKCGSLNTVPIVYGYPAGTAIEKARRGESVLGSCMVSGNDPQSSCKDCRNRW